MLVNDMQAKDLKGSGRCVFVGAVPIFALRDTNTIHVIYASRLYSAKFHTHTHTHIYLFIYSKSVLTIELMVMKLFIKKRFHSRVDISCISNIWHRERLAEYVFPLYIYVCLGLYVALKIQVSHFTQVSLCIFIFSFVYFLLVSCSNFKMSPNSILLGKSFHFSLLVCLLCICKEFFNFSLFYVSTLCCTLSLTLQQTSFKLLMGTLHEFFI